MLNQRLLNIFRGIYNSHANNRVYFKVNKTNYSTTAVNTRIMDVIPVEDLKEFIERCMDGCGTKAAHATALANVLIDADMRGHYSHGLNRLTMYIDDIKSGTNAKSGEPVVLKETAATAWVDGVNVLGPVVGGFCMGLAVAKAKDCGVGWVCAKGSNHYGIAGHYSMMAMREGLLGMSFTNTSPFMVPTRAKERLLGTNPLTVAAPGIGNDGFVLDMATTSVALGKLELAERKGETIPHGWGVDGAGASTANPGAAMHHGGLSPLGGTEATGGYKGYGLGLVVEILCGVMSGAAYGPAIRNWVDKTSEANLGQCFIAVDPGAFAPGFEGRVSELLGQLRASEPGPGQPGAVLVPGDKARQHGGLVERVGGIPYPPAQIQYMYEVAEREGVPPTRVIKSSSSH